MTTVRREGKWTLEKDQEGKYAICERGEVRAQIVTDDYEPQGMMGDLTSNIMADEYEVRNFSEAEELFHDYIEELESGGGGIW